MFFALALFFGGIATLFAKRRVTNALLALSIVVLLTGALNVAVGFAR